MSRAPAATANPVILRDQLTINYNPTDTLDYKTTKDQEITAFLKNEIGNENILIELNSNNPPTVKQYTRFNFLSSGNKLFQVFESSADQVFTWSSGLFPTQADGTWYLYLDTVSDTNTILSIGTYGASQNAPSYDAEKGGYYNSDGKVIASFISSSGTVSNLLIYEKNLIRATFNPIITPGKIGEKYLNTSSKIQFIAFGVSASSDWIPNVIISISDPVSAPNFVGQKFINTTNENIYTSKGTSSVNDWYNLTAATPLSVKTDTNSNYEILDDDGYDSFEQTKSTSSGTSTHTLPTAADNVGRILRFKLIQNSTGTGDYWIIDGEGAETIDGDTTVQLNGNNDYLVIYSNGTEWKKIAIKATYETPWINRSDWTNVQPGSTTTLNVDSNIVHNLGVYSNRLRVKLFISETGADSSTTMFEGIMTQQDNSAAAGASLWNVSVNQLVIYFYAMKYLTTSYTVGALTTQNWYYKIVVERVR